MAEIGTLVLSSTRGRYAIGDSEHGADLTAGLRIEICFGEEWVSGHVEYDPELIYVLPGPQRLEDAWQVVSKPKGIPGYYVELDDGEVVGLCAGMRVRIL